MGVYDYNIWYNHIAIKNGFYFQLMNLKKIRNLIVVSFLTAMMNNANTFADQQFTGGLIELQNAILGAGTTDLNRTFVQTENISLTENLHELSGAPLS